MNVDDIKQVAVVGAGLIGHGIALEFAKAGYEVSLNSRSDESLQRAAQMIRESLRMLAKMGLVSSDQAEAIPSKIQMNTSLEESVQDVDVVIEAVYEDLILKQHVLRELDRLCPERVILASSTSTLLPGKLAQAVRNPERVVVAHYINPPHLVPLVEIVRGEQTSDEAVAVLHGLLEKVGKSPVVVQKELPGFISGRLQMVVLKEALWLVQNGFASPQDVDFVLKSSLGRRWSVAGVFEVLEIAGWDLISEVASEIAPDLDSSLDSLRLLDEKVEQGELGAKTGKGFYDWTPESVEAARSRIAHALVEIEKWSRSS